MSKSYLLDISFALESIIPVAIAISSAVASYHLFDGNNVDSIVNLNDNSTVIDKF